jgi:hypothetical protein
MEIVAVLLCLLVIATPILAILAFTRVQQLSEQVQAARLQELVARVYSLEQRIAAIGKGLAAPTRHWPRHPSPCQLRSRRLHPPPR